MITFEKTLVIAGLVFLLGAWLAGCTPAPTLPHRSVAPSGPGIGIGITSDICPDLIVKAGNYIAWTNLDTRVHIVKHTPQDGDAQFSSGPLQPGDGFEVRLTEPGEYRYQCSDGDTERGIITVEP